MPDDSTASYRDFLDRKMQAGAPTGFAPVWMPEFLYDFQTHLLDWSVRKGRAAIFADCGLGKTPMQLAWAENVRRKTNRSVLILTPLAVAQQTAREGEKFGIEVSRSPDQAARIVVTNYEKLHQLDPADYAGVVCDESSILKSLTGARRKQITRFMLKTPYRLLCTATAAPNDWVELGTSSEALGELSNSEMLRRFFRYLDDKGQRRELRLVGEAEAAIESNPSYYRKLAFRVSQTIGQYRLKHHAEQSFWRWVCSWARACRKPSDLGFSDDRFDLPPLVERLHVIEPDTPPDGHLFNLPAIGLHEERQERRRTLHQRCDLVAGLVDHDRPAVVWCQMNAEADRLVEIVPGAEQVAGRTPDDRKVELYEAFAAGELRVLIVKPKIGAWGLNWQHCRDVVTFVSHSYEQRYQAIRRCWRFGQTGAVSVDTVATIGEQRVIENIQRKEAQASEMFDRLVAEMTEAERQEIVNRYTNPVEVPQWLSPSS